MSSMFRARSLARINYGYQAFLGFLTICYVVNCTRFTVMGQPIFPAYVSMKLRKWLNNLTFATLLFRHLTTSIVVKSLGMGAFARPLAVNSSTNRGIL